MAIAARTAYRMSRWFDVVVMREPSLGRVWFVVGRPLRALSV
jgi:hypothetical protein